MIPEKIMIPEKFKALIVKETETGVFQREIGERYISDLPDGDVLIEVHYSALNYKDALSARGHKGITRNYPHTPGIDAAGKVVQSSTNEFPVGSNVLVTGYDLGMNTSGGFAEYIRVPKDWVVPLPGAFSFKEAMFYGTAGFTASLCINEIIRNDITPDCGDVLVSGATGGVGTLAVAILSKIGYRVVASTGKTNKYDYLSSIGASEILTREELDYQGHKPLLAQRWAAAVDNVGGNTLATILKQTMRRGVVTSVGLTGGDTFELTVYPFILRGVMLNGIDSAERPMNIRRKIWDKIANEWRVHDFGSMSKIIYLDQIEDELSLMLKGEQSGKIIVEIKSE